MQRISILALTKSTGGLSFYNRQLLSGLDRERFDSHTICLSDGGEDYAAGLNAQGLSAEAMPMARYDIDVSDDFRVFRRVLGVVRRRRPDVIVCHGSKSGIIGRAAGRAAGTPAVYRQASLPFERRVQGAKAPIYWALEFAARPLGGNLVALSAGARDVTVARRLWARDRIDVIHTGVDTARFHPAKDRDAAVARLGLDPSRPVVGWIARFERQKAPFDFVDAAAQVAAERPEAQFVMAGEGALRDAAAARAQAAGLQMRFLPWQKDPAAALRAFDVFALSSHWEGLPIALLEAMATGCAPVSTNVDGCAEVVEHDVSGLLVPAGAPGAFAVATIALLADPARRAAVGRAARLRVEQAFTVPQMVQSWENLFHRLARRRSEPANSAAGSAAGSVAAASSAARRPAEGES